MSTATVLPVPQSLADELSAALKQGQPLVVMVSLEHCPFCRVARDSYLTPLRRQEHVPVVQIDMRTAAQVRDFSQKTVTHDDLARAWAIKVAPTVLFFGPGGKEIAERLVGGYIPDFYGAYLDQRMQTARKALRG
jgi:thioredoxin-related protein